MIILLNCLRFFNLRVQPAFRRFSSFLFTSVGSWSIFRKEITRSNMLSGFFDSLWQLSSPLCLWFGIVYILSEIMFHWIQISSRNLDRVRKLKSSMTRLNARVQKVLYFQILVLTCRYKAPCTHSDGMKQLGSLFSIFFIQECYFVALVFVPFLWWVCFHLYWF